MAHDAVVKRDRVKGAIRMPSPLHKSRRPKRLCGRRKTSSMFRQPLGDALEKLIRCSYEQTAIPVCAALPDELLGKCSRWLFHEPRQPKRPRSAKSFERRSSAQIPKPWMRMRRTDPDSRNGLMSHRRPNRPANCLLKRVRLTNPMIGWHDDHHSGRIPTRQRRECNACRGVFNLGFYQHGAA